MDEDLYHAKRMEMIGGFFQVVLLASEIEIDGERHAYITSTLAVDAIEHLRQEFDRTGRRPFPVINAN